MVAKLCNIDLQAPYSIYCTLLLFVDMYRLNKYYSWRRQYHQWVAQYHIFLWFKLNLPTPSGDWVMYCLPTDSIFIIQYYKNIIFFSFSHNFWNFWNYTNIKIPIKSRTKRRSHRAYRITDRDNASQSKSAWYEAYSIS